MDTLISTVTAIIVGVGVVTCIAAGIAVAGLVLALSCMFFKSQFMEWVLVLRVVEEANRQGRSVFKKRHGAGE